MTPIPIPHPEKRRALIVVDMQAGFLKSRTDRHRFAIDNIKKVVNEGNYELFIEANFHAEPGSIWDKQTQWVFKLEPTIPEIKTLLPQGKTVLVTKTTKSTFGGDKDAVAILKENKIEEVHVVGVDTNDCVLATAFDSFDAGFFTYVLEECTSSSSSDEQRDHAIEILRNVDLTNKSLLIRSFKTI